MMNNIVEVPHDWAVIGVQRPLFLDHKHTVMVRNVRVVRPGCVRVRWSGVSEGELAGRDFSETFNLTKRKGKERFKDFLFAVPLEVDDGVVDLEGCVGRHVEVMALQKPAGQSSRIEIIHHLLQ